MESTTKNNKVIKNKKSKKAVGKSGNLFERFLNHFKNNKNNIIYCLIAIVILLVVLILTFFIRMASLNKTIITINDVNYTKSDFMIYFYSVKYDYFGAKNTNVSNENLKVVIDSSSNVTVGEYLKEKALNEIKTAAVINKYASDNNVTLTNEDLENLKSEKKAYIKSLGGKYKFKKFLRDNKTTEKSYDKMAETDKLYNKILEKLYGEGKRKDLTEEEKTAAQENYNNTYFKIEQVILATIDLDTRKSLSDLVINQKQTLAHTISDLAHSGTNFEELIRKYSEDAVDKEEPFYVYYKKGELLTELEETIRGLGNNEISDVIQTKYAFHIIKRLELDDSKYSEYLDELREEKALKDLNATLDDLKIIYHDAYKKIKI